MRSWTVGFVPLAFVLGGCANDISTLEAQPGTVVATQRAPGIDFAAYRTFAIPTQLALVSDDTGAAGTLDAPTLLAAISAHLEARGFVKLADVDPVSPRLGAGAADLAIDVTALESARTDAGYWSSFPGYAGPAAWGRAGDGWSYPWAWVGVGFRRGTVLVEVIDLRSAAAQATPQAIWASVSYGVAADLGSYDSPEAVASIDQAFQLAPYLQAAP